MRTSLASRCTPLLLLSLIIIGCSEEPARTPGQSLRYEEPTNVLLFVAPDVGTTLGCYGEAGVQTPRLDMLSRMGVRFENAYAASSVQGASRASLLTGRMPAHLEDAPTWGQLFSDAGYRTGLIGDLGVEGAQEYPFDYRSGTTGTDAAIRSAKWHTEALDRFLSEGQGRPWALVVSLQDSRWPFPKDGAPFGNVDLPPHQPGEVSVPPKLVDTPAVRTEIKRYYDGLRRMDAMVGAVVDRLAAKGLRRHTVCVFTSDNGPPFPFARATLYEDGVRVPLIVWGKRVEVGAVYGMPMSLVDVVPTLLKIASEAEGAVPFSEAVRASLDGAPFDYFLGEERILGEEGRTAPEWRDQVTTTLDGHGDSPAVPSAFPSRAVRFGDWKYIRSWSEGLRFESLSMQRSATWRAVAAEAETGDAEVAARMKTLTERPQEELFHLAEDPGELVNLAADPAHAAKLNEGRERLKNAPELVLPGQ